MTRKNYWDVKIEGEAYGVGCYIGGYRAEKWLLEKKGRIPGGSLQQEAFALMEMFNNASSKIEKSIAAGTVVGFFCAVEQGHASNYLKEDRQARIDNWPKYLAYLQRRKAESEQRERVKAASKPLCPPPVVKSRTLSRVTAA